MIPTSHDIDARLDDLIATIRADIAAWERFYWQGVVPIDPNSDADRVRATLEWSAPSKAVTEKVNSPGMDIDAGREKMRQELREFMNSGDSVLLLRVDAGVGKSTALIRMSQAVARRGLNVLYLMPYHRYWQDIMNNDATDPGLWYHWQSIDGKTEGGDDMCRYSGAAASWTGKGYPLMELCKQVCKADGHIGRCSYRLQRRTPEKIKAGVHPHLVTGIAVDNIKLCVVDELPIGQFLPERIIKPSNIQVAPEYTHSDTKTLLAILEAMTKGVRFGERLDGKRLLDAIGTILGNLYEKITLVSPKGNDLQQIPPVEDLDDVEKAGEWYLFDMLRLLIPEYYAWKNGLQDWLTRVYLSHDGIHLLQRKMPWSGLPDKLVILDATGKQEIYEKLLNRPVKVVDISTKRTGRIFQVTGRLNNITSVLDKKTGQLRKSGHEAAELIRLIRQSKPLGSGQFGKYRNIGIVTFKGIVEQLGENLKDLPGVSSVWYQGSRGTNVLEGVDCLVCLGSPAIPDNQIIDVFSQLNYEPGVPQDSAIRPFKRIEIGEGRSRPLRHAGIVEYFHINDKGESPKRYLTGFWDYPELQTVADLFTSDELVQAIGRGRIPFRDCDVWLLTSALTPLVIDKVYGDPSECLNMPVGIDWRHWASISKVLESRDVIRATDLADATGVTRAWASHWIKIIAVWDRSYSLSQMGSGRGRKEIILVKS